MGYYINQRTTGDRPDQSLDIAADLARWGVALEHGSAQERRAALQQLVGAGAEEVLTRCVASVNPTVVQLALSGLWECWLDQAGPTAREELELGIDSMNDGNFQSAAETFAHVADRYPDWAEAINKLATVLYLQNKPEASIELCRQVVALKPDHFGAWNGLTLCAVQIEDWPLAYRAARESLRLQPHSPANRQLLHLIESRLPPT